MKKIKKVTYYRAKVNIGAFPLDMLRYDGAFVAPGCVKKESDSDYWQPVKADEYIVAYVKFSGERDLPESRRWASFGVRLEKIDVDITPELGNDWVTFENQGPHQELAPVTLATYLTRGY